MTVNKADAARVSGTANLVVDQAAPDPRLYHLSGTCRDGRTDRLMWTPHAGRIRLPREGADFSSVSLVPQQRLSGTVSAQSVGPLFKYRLRRPRKDAFSNAIWSPE